MTRSSHASIRSGRFGAIECFPDRSVDAAPGSRHLPVLASAAVASGSSRGAVVSRGLPWCESHPGGHGDGRGPCRRSDQSGLRGRPLRREAVRLAAVLRLAHRPSLRRQRAGWASSSSSRTSRSIAERHVSTGLPASGVERPVRWTPCRTALRDDARSELRPRQLRDADAARAGPVRVRRRAGAGPDVAHAETRCCIRRRNSTSTREWARTPLPGLDIRLHGWLSLVGEYKFTLRQARDRPGYGGTGRDDGGDASRRIRTRIRLCPADILAAVFFGAWALALTSRRFRIRRAETPTPTSIRTDDRAVRARHSTISRHDVKALRDIGIAPILAAGAGGALVFHPHRRQRRRLGDRRDRSRPTRRSATLLGSGLVPGTVRRARTGSGRSRPATRGPRTSAATSSAHRC